MTPVDSDTRRLDDFLDRLRAAFARQDRGVDGRGAVVLDAHVTGGDDTDFGIEVTFSEFPSGPVLKDTIPAVRAYMKGCGAKTADDLAAFWMQELDEQLLAADSP